MVWWQIYLIIFVLAAIFSLVITPVFEKLARRTGFMDTPMADTHNRHDKATPVLGGVAMFTAWVMTVSICIFAGLSMHAINMDESVSKHFSGISQVSTRLIFLFAGALVATLTGFVDDYYKLSAKVKFGGQLCAAIIAVWLGGIRITLFIDCEALSWIISILWILTIINALNFLDNMDGLAVGIAAIAMFLLTVVAVIGGQHFIAALGAAGTGCTVGFWFFNHHPASIFMGDSGSHFLGYSLAVLSAGASYYVPEVSSTKLTFLIPLFILAIPLFDAVTVVFIRLYHKKPIYIGDHNHISHRFVKMGMNRKRAVLMVHMLTFVVGLGVLPLMWADIKTSVIVIIQALAFMLIVTLLQFSGGYDIGSINSAKKPE